MRLGKVKSCLLALSVLWGCGDVIGFHGKNILGVGGKSSENKATEVDEHASTTIEYDWAFAIETMDLSKKIDDPVELMFLLDNSESMSDNIDKLRVSMGGFVEGLKSEGLPYRARILPMNLLVDQLQEVGDPKGTAPFGLFQSDLPSYDRPQDGTYYGTVDLVTPERGVTPLDLKLLQIAGNVQDLENEPGICLAMDYTSWLKWNTGVSEETRLGDDRKVHFVLLSDEDNAEKHEIYDESTGDPIEGETRELLCYQDRISTQQCHENPYNIYYSWDEEYCYKYTEYDPTRYYYEGRYNRTAKCKRLGWQPADVDQHELYVLKNNQRCVTDEYDCQTDQVLIYECDIVGNGQKVELNQDYEALGIETCTVPKEFACTRYKDRQPVRYVVSREDVLYEKETLNRSCYPVGDPVNDPEGVPEEETADISASNKVNFEVHSCIAYESCMPKTYARQNVFKDDSTLPGYSDCTMVNSGAGYGVDPKEPTATPAYRPDGESLAGIALSCPNMYRLEAQANTWTLFSEVCRANREDLSVATDGGVGDLPEGTTHEFARWSENTEEQYSVLFYAPVTDNAELLPAIASKYGDTVTLADILDVNERIVTPSRIINLGCYTYQKWEPDSSYAKQTPGFTETITSGAPFRELDSSSRKPPPENHREFPDDVMMEKVYEDAGEHAEKTCADKVTIEHPFKPTPGDFLALMKELYPRTSITWHSIVQTSSQGCSDEEEYVAVGNTYMDLSRKTDGVVENICADDFREFVEKLTRKVLTEVNVSYRIPRAMRKLGIEKVVNTNTGKTLKEGRDYWISEGYLVFDKTVIKESDEIGVFFRG